MTIEIIDFDNIDEWTGSFEDVLRPLMTGLVRKRLAESKLPLVEDTRDLLLKLINRAKVIDAVLDWLYSKKIAGYHGTRITELEINSIKSNGLLPLSASNRRDRLIRALSPHPKWNEVAKSLDQVIQSHGQGNREGKREGQTHLTLSMAGLVDDFNHYLVYGSEFDQRIAEKLLGREGLDLLSKDGESTIIRVVVPGDAAVKAAHPFFSVEKVRDQGEVPNLVNEFLKSWSYRVSNPKFQTKTLKVDCGMIFWETVPATWIADIRTVEIPFNQRVY